MTSRLELFQSLLSLKRLDAYLVTEDRVVSYLTGILSADSWLLVTPKKVDYITDFRYSAEVKKQLPGIFKVWQAKKLSTTLAELIQRRRVSRLGFDDRQVSFSLYLSLKKGVPKSVKWLARPNLVDDVCMIKQPDEIQKMGECIKINKKAFDFAQDNLKPGMTEQDLNRKVDSFVRDQGASFSFDPIIAFGPNSSYPHARVTERKLRKNDIVLLDVGIEREGFKSDLTRMFFLGKIAPLVRQIVVAVEEAQKAAIAMIRPGVMASEIDQEARKSLKKQGLAKYFGHSLGHGVGLAVHETPRISATSQTILAKNMVFTIEPGVYYTGQFGVRIEDMILVTDQGCQILSR